MPPRILVDSNVLLDVLAPGSEWEAWSDEAIMVCAEYARLFINPIIYAEVSVGYRTMAGVVLPLSEDLFTREALPWRAAFLAGKAFEQYRRSGGVRRSPLPDFYIGAHAAVGGMRLLTRDPRRYRAYFPAVELIAPDTWTSAVERLRERPSSPPCDTRARCRRRPALRG
jgi:predicted nucleic acid-binding protein